jgi:4-alpha-glucanotransferase
VSRGAGSALRRLAERCGLEPSYRDVGGVRRTAGAETLVAALRALDAPLERVDDAPAALAAVEHAGWREPLEPVVVAWDGRLPGLVLRLPRAARGRVTWTVRDEAGTVVTRWQTSIEAAPVVAAEAGLRGSLARHVDAPSAPLPFGYHRLVAEGRHVSGEALVIAAPRRVWTPDDERPRWGTFAPLHALRSARSWGVGDFSDLRSLGDFVRGFGAAAVGLLPIYPAFLDEPFDPSPYAPVTRLGWNELHLDVEALPELDAAPRARALLRSPGLRAELRRLRAAPLVDHRRAMRLKRRVLEAVAEACGDTAALADFERGHPVVRDYARFRAVGERLAGRPWPTWPARLRDGRVRAGDYDPRSERYHRVVQWLADRELAAAAGPGGRELYLDLPVGTHAYGHETWRERGSFALDLEVGAPPDPFFAAGQRWGFPPPHPERTRRLGHRHAIAVLRHAMSRASVLRLDHVMGLHRLFCVPAGRPAGDGAYVRYPAEELWALASLESHRARCLLVGENLGTVPPAVHRGLRRHEVAGMYVLQFEVTPRRPAIPPPRPGDLACLGTHDMAPFAAFWRATDVGERLRLGLLDRTGAKRERAARARLRAAIAAELVHRGLLQSGRAPATRVGRACLELLAASQAGFVLVALDDLWAETAAHNVPGTTDRHPNWRRRLRRALQEIVASPEVAAALRAVDAARARR